MLELDAQIITDSTQLDIYKNWKKLQGEDIRNQWASIFPWLRDKDRKISALKQSLRQENAELDAFMVRYYDAVPQHPTNIERWLELNPFQATLRQNISQLAGVR